MKPQIFSMRKVPVTLICFLLLMTTTIGCGVFFIANGLTNLDPIILKKDDLPMRRLTSTRHGDWGLSIAEFEQDWDGKQLSVRYYLFDSLSTAQKVAAHGGTWRFAVLPNIHPELNPEDVIGDATWHYIRDEQDEETTMIFVKNSVLVHITASGHPSHRLQFVRDVARKIEAKIAAVLPKNENGVPKKLGPLEKQCYPAPLYHVTHPFL